MNKHRSNAIKGLIFLITFFIFALSSIFGLFLLFVESLFPSGFFDKNED